MQNAKSKTIIQNVKVFDLKQRSINFSLEIIKFLESFSKDYILQTIGRQLLRSATSIGANVVEAQAAPSKRDFARFFNIALQSANETKYWLSLLNKSCSNFKNINELEIEANELSKILVKSLITIRENKSSRF